VTARAAAVAYAAHGLHVLPLIGKRPHPMLGNAGGYRHATTNADAIARWWATDPEAGVGTGLVASGLVAFDAEGPVKGGQPGAVVRALRAAYGIGAAWAAVTPSQGVHLLLRWPEDAPSCPTRLTVHHDLAPLGLDLMKRSGHLTLPATLGPSPDPAGRSWAIAPDGPPPQAPDAMVAEAEAAAALVERDRQAVTAPRAFAGDPGAPWTPRGRAYLTAAHARCMAAERGQRHAALLAFSTACVRAMRAGEVAEDHARALVAHAGAHLMPDDPADVAGLIRSTFTNPDRFAPLGDRPKATNP
jgi:hypothetical protein